MIKGAHENQRHALPLVWPIGDDAFGIIDQTRLPHEFVTLTLKTADEAAHAIRSMQTRGAPLIGASPPMASRSQCAPIRRTRP
ncbi:MAG: hypothetical protein WDN08_12990 [Rhizomicrobium sp.]